jgi:tetratricopeptide (TPR) repeat protein
MTRTRKALHRAEWWLILGVLLLALPLAARAQAPPTAQELLQQGFTAFQAQQYQRSLELFQKAYKEKPTLALVNFYLGVNLRLLKRPREAVPYLTEALERDPALTQTNYQLGLAYFEARQYGKALAAFRKAKESFPDSALLYYYEALVLLDLGRPKEALGPLARAQELDRGFQTRAAYLRGVAHFRLGQAEEAKAAFKEVRTLEPDSTLAAEAVKSLRALDTVTKPPKRFTFRITSGFQYDDNVVVEPDGFTFLGGVIPTGPFISPRNADGRGTVSLWGQYRHPLAEGLEAGLHYSTYAALHGNLPHFNLNNHNPGAYLGIHRAPVYLRIEYDYLFSFLGNDSSVSFHSGGPNLFFTLSPKLVSQLKFRFRDKVFFENRRRDADTYVVTANQYFYVLGDGGYLRLGYQWEDEETRSPAYETDAGSLIGGLYLPLPWGLSLSANAEMENREYDNNFLGFGVRDEDLFTASATLTKLLRDGWGVSLSYTRLDNNSNIEDYDYEQNIYGFNVIYEY